MHSQSISSLSPVSDPALLTAISLTSFSALLLELALTRLFSVVLFYHFAFLAISVALLGLGAGGVFAYLWRNWLASRHAGWRRLYRVATRSPSSLPCSWCCTFQFPWICRAAICFI